MNKKFLVFFGKDFKPFVQLAVCGLHREIEPCEKVIARSGGGSWLYNKHMKVLRLYDESTDFGKYDKDEVMEAFNNGRMFYFDMTLKEAFGEIKELILD